MTDRDIVEAIDAALVRAVSREAARADRAEAALADAQPVLEAVARWRAAEMPPDAHNKVYAALNALAIAWDAYAHPEDHEVPS